MDPFRSISLSSHCGKDEIEGGEKSAERRDKKTSEKVEDKRRESSKKRSQSSDRTSGSKKPKLQSNVSTLKKNISLDPSNDTLPTTDDHNTSKPINNTSGKRNSSSPETLSGQPVTKTVANDQLKLLDDCTHPVTAPVLVPINIKSKASPGSPFKPPALSSPQQPSILSASHTFHQTKSSVYQVGQYSSDFLIMTWGIETEEGGIATFRNELQQMDKTLRDKYLGYLGGEMKLETSNELVEFCNRFPTTFSGLFVLAVLITDYCFIAATEELVNLCISNKLLNPDLKTVCEKASLMQLEKYVRMNPQEVADDESKIPAEIWNKINFGFINDGLLEVRNAVSRFEYGSLIDLSKAILNIAVVSVDTSTIVNACAFKRRSNLALYSPKWKLMDMETSIFKRLLDLDLSNEENVLLFFYLKTTTDGIIPIKLHEAVVKRYGDGKPDPDVLISGTKNDKDVLISLLYEPDQWESTFRSCISFSVYKMVAQLKIKNACEFVFRTKDRDELGKMGSSLLFQIDVTERNEDQVKKAKFKTGDEELTEDELLQIFVNFQNLTEEDLKWVKSCTNFGLNEYDWYRLLLRWCYYHTLKLSPTSLYVYDERVDTKFKRLKEILNVEHMYEYWSLMNSQRYLLREIICATVKQNAS